ncbi:hypothetical protein C8D87_107328 [Lentzea atacamensis]|uniref:Secreted protein n=1 Tax=Lentzea atacamensis TaxID=531938 RepID=A0ABX9E3K0_9PSEU|nr:hypothetical protein [Lentzea atacamensis]RAS63179.1 hypothetical protein C8D87_107328 [Lentzea atacamensis]
MRKLFVAGVAALMACLVVPPAASAETPAAASWCAPPGSEGNGTMNVFIVPTSGDNCGVLRMVAQLAPVSGLPTQTGFFRMYGPNGHIGDSTTKYWTYQESYRVDVNQKAFDGSLWCAEFWMQTGSTFTRGSEPVCAEF